MSLIWNLYIDGKIAEQVLCDGCSTKFKAAGQETKATVALALRGKMHVDDIAKACAGFVWEGGASALYAALVAGGFSAQEAQVLSGQVGI